MAGGPSPTSTSPSNLSMTPLHSSFSSTSTSPPQTSFPSQNTMSADGFSTTHTYSNPPAPIGERRGLERNGNGTGNGHGMSLFSLSEAEPAAEPRLSAICLRKLPSNSDRDAVRNILLFSEDLVECEMVSAPRYPVDIGYATAVARFRTPEGAQEAVTLLHGRRNASGDATLIVELVPEGLQDAIGSRRNTVESASARQGSVSTPSGIGGPTNGRQSSRYNGTFQNMDRMSPPNGTPGLGNGEIPNLFSGPTSPVNTSFGPRNSGRSVIYDTATDDDDDGLLTESFGLGAVQSVPRRTTNPSFPTRFNDLTLNTNPVNAMSSPPMSNYASPRSAAVPMQSPANPMSAISPHSMPHGPNGTYTQYNQHTQHYPRNTYPPVNPADQNPPCNTLYVGNLPVDTSEDELKSLFSKQRGYKRLCFRTKQNGPMCFVEFEDITAATRSLTDLYGALLHNSVKGGIRLSFSKNPLGVRSGQSAGMGPVSAGTPITPLSAFGSIPGGLPVYAAATGPPPGLTAPPGLPQPGYSNGSNGYGMYTNGGFGVPNNEMAPLLRSQPPMSAHPSNGNGFSSSNGNHAANGNGFSSLTGNHAANGNGFSSSNGSHAANGNGFPTSTGNHAANGNGFSSLTGNHAANGNGFSSSNGSHAANGNGFPTSNGNHAVNGNVFPTSNGNGFPSSNGNHPYLNGR